MKLSMLLLIGLCTGLFQTQKVIFDIPRLAGKNMIQIKRLLGPPRYDNVPSELQVRAGVTGDALYVKGDFTLDINYEPVSKKVIDFFISRTHSVSDPAELAAAGNVSGSGRFSVKPIGENRHPSLFTGITVTAL